MRSLSAGGVGLFAAVAKGAKPSNRSFESSVTGNNVTAGEEEIKLQGMTTKEQIEKLIPLDLDIEQIGSGFEFGENHAFSTKNRAMMITDHCYRLSDGSDLSLEELESECTVKDLSL